MGCSTSKLEEEEAVQISRNRKNFVKEAIKQRKRIASSHVSYIQSLHEVSAALCNFIEGNEHHQLLLDKYKHYHQVPETIRIVSYQDVEDPCKMGLNSTIEVGTDIKQMKKYHTYGIVGLYAKTGQQMVESTQSRDDGEENPTFKVSFNMKLTSIPQAMRVIETQFKKICDCAEEISEILEITRYRHYPSSFNELTGKIISFYNLLTIN